MEIVKSYRDYRFRLLENPGKGLVDTLNYGASAAQTDWIVRMDADDIMHPDRLQQLWDFVSRSPQVDLVASRAQAFADAPLRPGFLEYMRWQNNVLTPEEIGNQIYVESPFAHPSVMIRKSILEQAGGYRQGDFPEDYELWLRLHHRGTSMIKLPESLLQWRDSPHRLSRSHPAYRREAFDRLRAEYLATDPRLNANRPLVYWGAGRNTRKRCRLLIEKGFPPVAWIDVDPKKIGKRIEQAEVVDPAWLERQTEKPFVLAYVTNHGAREEIAEALERMGYRVGSDYLAVG
jgi:glycosyltransferase involved in cell wall biosynthesis